MRLFRSHIESTGRCLFVVPGQSADHVLSCLGFGHIAAVNRAALIIPGPIDWSFCNDLEALEQIRPAWDRIRSFVVPDQLGIDGHVSEKSWAEYPGVPHERALIFPHLPHTSCVSDVDAVIEDSERLATCNSACGGLHAMGRLGYRQVWVLGCDGGTGYASLLRHGSHYRDFSVIKDRMHQIARLIGVKHGTDVRFWPERFEA